MTKEELNFIKDAFSQIIDDIAGNPDWGDAAKAVASDLGTLERKLEKRVTELPSDLDEAAKETAKGLYLDKHNLIWIFKAGARWLAEQGVKLHGKVLPGPRCNLYIESDCFDRGFGGLNYKFSDSNDVDIFVQIRKK